mgnify:CR=1 FL=1
MNLFLQNDIDEILNLASRELNSLRDKKILLAGGKGFLGRYFSEVIHQYNKLHERKINLILIDNFSSSNDDLDENSETKNINFINGDICNLNTLKNLKDFDYIIHAAGIASPFYYRSKPLQTIDVSINGSRNLLEMSKKFGSKFIFFSSSEIYGDPDPKKIPIQESYRGNVSTLGPRACYDESKRLGETLCYVYNSYSNVHTNIIRPFNIYGPGMQENDYRVMPNFASKIKSNQNLKLYGSAKQTRTFCYITDAMTGFLRVILLGKFGEIYNIGNQLNEISMINLVKIFDKILKKRNKYKLINYPKNYPADEPMRRCPNINKAIQDTKYNPKVSVEEGVYRVLKYNKLSA